jgi:glucose/arabinose dehydrogenase
LYFSKSLLSFQEEGVMPNRISAFLFLFCFLFFRAPSASLSARATTVTGSAGSVLQVQEYGVFNEPWAMVFLPGGEILVTEKSGNLLLVNITDHGKTNT